MKTKNEQMKTKNNKKTLLTVACCAFVAQATNSQAATLMVTSGGVDYTIVEADPFAAGGTAGNTTAVGGGFFSAPTSSATTMRDRTVNPFITGYQSILGATDRIFEISTGGGPEIVTTVNGLVSGSYDIFVVYLYLNNGAAGIAHLRANLNDVIGSTGTIELNETNPTTTIGVPGPDWSIGIGKIGTTAAGATSFSVNIDDADNPNISDRMGYIGVAYVPVPEPSSLIFMGLGVLGVSARRVRRA